MEGCRKLILSASRQYKRVTSLNSRLPRSQSPYMGTSQGCANVLIRIQTVIHLPVAISPEGTKVSPHEEFCTKNKYSRVLLCWSGNKVALLTFSVLFLLYIKHLHRNWQEGRNMEKISLYTILFSMTSLALAAMQTMENNQTIAFGATEAFKVSKFQMAPKPFSRRLPKFKEFSIYIFAGGLFVMVPVALLLPFVLDYHPFGLLVQSLFSGPLPTCLKMLSNILGSLVYSFMFLHGGCTWLFLFLIIVYFGESIQVASDKLWMNHSNFIQTGCISYASAMRISNLGSTVDNFTECWRLYNIIRILIQEGISSVDKFVQSLLVMGCLLATGSGFALIKLDSKIPITFYVAAVVLLPLVITGVLILTTFAATPKENGSRYKIFWKERLIKKLDLARLQACPPIGYSFGFIRNCKRSTALVIMDVIVNSIASVALL